MKYSNGFNKSSQQAFVLIYPKLSVNQLPTLRMSRCQLTKLSANLSSSWLLELLGNNTILPVNLRII